MSEYYFEHTIDDPKILINYISPSSDIYNGPIGSWVFRGQKNSEWGLIPKILRKDIGKEWKELDGVLEQPIGKFSEIQNSLIRKFVILSDKIGLKIPNDNHEFRSKNIQLNYESLYVNYLEMVGIAQHHGIPTLLLDFTYNGLVAAFFAAYDYYKSPKHEKFISIYGLNVKNIIDNNYITDLQVASIPSYSNNYLFNQEALFLYDGAFGSQKKVGDKINMREQDIGNLFIKECEMFKADEGVKVIKTNYPSYKFDELLRQLIRCGITLPKIFPIYDSVQKQMKLESDLGISRIQ